MVTSIAQRERQALCRLFGEVGPLSPTLCEGWTTSDLVAHLFVRERRPLEAPGILVPALGRLTERAMESAKRRYGYAGLVARVRSGPPPPFSLVDAQMNLFEYFVHHEDVRRAADEWEPRNDTALDTALWSKLRIGGRLLARRLRGAGLELEAPGFGTAVVKVGDPRAIISGGPQELAMFLAGRQAAARLEIGGPDSARGVIEEAPFGL